MGYAIEYKTHPEANENYPVTYYCYENDCKVRKKHKGTPHSEGTYKYTKVISKNGKPYYRKRWVCDYCGKVMVGTVSQHCSFTVKTYMYTFG